MSNSYDKLIDLIIKHEETIAQLQGDINEHNLSFDLQWKAQQRAIKRWQEATGKELVRPDRADLCVWLMEQLDNQQAALDAVQRTHDDIAKMQDLPEYIASVALKLTIKSLREALAKADGGDVEGKI